jgi:hypothetical protein
MAQGRLCDPPRRKRCAGYLITLPRRTVTLRELVSRVVLVSFCAGVRRNSVTQILSPRDSMLPHHFAESLPDTDRLLRVLSNDRDVLARRNIEAGRPVFIPRIAFEVLLNDLFSPRESIAPAHGEIMADRFTFMARIRRNRIQQHILDQRYTGVHSAGIAE